MALIQVNPKDKARVFKILLSNGRFMGFADDKFEIIDHSPQVLEKLKKEGIQVKLLSKEN